MGREIQDNRKNKGKTIIIIGLLVLSFIVVTLVLKNYKVSTWSKDIVAPNAITVRNKFNAPLIAGTTIFEGQVQIYDKEIVEEIISMIKKGKYIRSCSTSEANNFNLDNISFSIGTIVYDYKVPANTLLTVNIFKDGGFIAEKKGALEENSHIVGKLRRDALEYLEKVYKNPAMR
jgi:hypothetical protein